MNLLSLLDLSLVIVSDSSAEIEKIKPWSSAVPTSFTSLPASRMSTTRVALKWRASLISCESASQAIGDIMVGAAFWAASYGITWRVLSQVAVV
jgi:hypothetical protein